MKKSGFSILLLSSAVIRYAAKSLSISYVIRTATALLLLFSTIGASAQEEYYVFYHEGSLGYLSNNSGTLGCSTSFSPSCVWIASGELVSGYSYDDNKTLKSYIDNSKYLNGKCNTRNNASSIGDYISFTTGAISSVVWHIDDNGFLCTTYDGVSSGGTKRYYTIYTSNGTTFKTDRTGAVNPPDPVPDHKFKAIKIQELTSNYESITPLTISGEKTTFSEVHETATFSHSSYEVPYVCYTIEDVTKYWYANSNNDTAPTGDINYTWTLEGIDDKYATVSSDGIVQYNEMIDCPSMDATLICKAIYKGTEIATASIPITFVNNNITVMPLIVCTKDESGTISATITTKTEGADIYFTIDGTDPTESSTRQKYDNPFTVEDGVTIKAAAYKEGFVWSDVDETNSHLEYAIMDAGKKYILTYNGDKLSTQTDGNIDSSKGDVVFIREHSAKGDYFKTKDGKYLGPTSNPTNNPNKLVLYDSSDNNQWSIDGSVLKDIYGYTLRCGQSITSDLWNGTTSFGNVLYRYYVVSGKELNFTGEISGPAEVSTSSAYVAPIECEDDAQMFVPNGGGTTYYYTKYGWYAGSNSVVDKVNYEWSISSTEVENLADYASVDDKGVVTYFAYVPGKETVKVTLTCRVSIDEQVKTQTKEILLVRPVKIVLPAISFGEPTESGIQVTLTHPDTEAKFYYTTDGSDPTTSSTPYTGPFNVAVGVMVKAIAVIEDRVSNIAVKVTSSPSTVVLNDYEDHNWIYYKGLNESIDANYNTNYKGQLYLPAPRNVKITYTGGAVEGSLTNVAISGLEDEQENTMIYYETLEKNPVGKELTGDYPYQVISNPFSKRPVTIKDETKEKPEEKYQYWGFAGWKIVSGGEHIQEYSNGAIVPLDAIIHFVDLDDGYTLNCTSAEIRFEATWTKARVFVGAGVSADYTNGTYETNFAIFTSSRSDAISLNSNRSYTIMAQSPDGGYTIPFNPDVQITGAVNVYSGNRLTDVAKYEWITFSGSSDINAQGRSLYLGRGIKNNGTSYRVIYGTNTADLTVNQTVHIESGIFKNVHHYNITTKGIEKQVFIYGCDYDRAKGNNTNLQIREKCTVSSSGVSGGVTITNISSDTEVARIYIKSGTLQQNVDIGDGSEARSYYLGFSNKETQPGFRYLEMQGGVMNSIVGGMGSSHDSTKPAVTIRVKGGHIQGAVYGAAAHAGAAGIRRLIFTGGEINGWIAGGANGTQTTGGKMNGDSFIYLGGTTVVKPSSTDPVIGSGEAKGGNIFGAGSGNKSASLTATVGQVNNSNIVVADNAEIERDVYGGGNYGYVKDDGTAKIYILGGTVGGSVYGGSNKQKGQTVNITMTDGLVKGGIYGGSNSTGSVRNNVNMLILGGQVGQNGLPANIHGGGYGKETGVDKNIDIKIGSIDSEGTASGTAVIYGDVYGGSALGTVNTGTDNHTTIKVYDGDFYGNVYGGGLGQKETSVGANDGVEAIVNGEVEVDVYGGKFHSTKTTETRSDDSKEISYYTTGQVFGCNNQAGTPKGKVTVNIFKTGEKVDGNEYAIGAVYGGGNEADYVPTYTPETGEVRQTTVNVVDCSSSIDYVYGGGNAADVPNTEVNVYGGNSIGSVFGGGNGVRGAAYAANIIGTGVGQKGTTRVNIYGGKIGEVYGGSNSNGDVTGSANVFLDEQPYDDTNVLCLYSIGGAYSAGNEAVMYGTSNLTIGCLSSKLDAIYGGAKNADVNNDIDLRITSGSFGKVFGGNNLGGSINGSIKVTIDETGCKPVIIDELYGGGNQAAYTTPEGKPEPTVNVISFTHIGEVFGGGYGAAAVVTGNPVVNINVIPGEHANEDEVKTYLDAHKLGSIGTVFGGGNAANVVGDTYVNIGTVTTNKHVSGTDTTTDHKVGAYITGNVYGGGNQADVTGSTHVVVGKPKTTSVTP